MTGIFSLLVRGLSGHDIERQANDQEEEYAEPEINLQIPERARLAHILGNQPADCSHDKLMELWIEAIDLMVALCEKRETVRRNRIRTRPQPKPFPLLLDPNQCPNCVGDERLPLEERTFKYCRPTVRNDHFDNQHLVRRDALYHQQDQQEMEKGTVVSSKDVVLITNSFKH
ncbi:uncharacterized protein ColSpa_11982 [Colletotrichum spaethianum]|uniref:FluG domain-containing protein n=1 Tax=Colletotrichum spaethianum TaxID=700344 RepID=A0AA37PGC6_9PEZI|nr:uncharacterized protein ColSpa_11982 [Colletotrichum spaethianum]GKT51801.1 hypothetical protein ColSpa_11982 [Colletotrichum spaethianum]